MSANYFANVGSTRTQGLDIQSDYLLHMHQYGNLDLTMALNLNRGEQAARISITRSTHPDGGAARGEAVLSQTGEVRPRQSSFRQFVGYGLQLRPEWRNRQLCPASHH